MDREEALQRAGEVIKSLAESLAKTGMHSIKEGEVMEIAEALK